MKANQRWIAGDALSWALGVGLGLLLGIALLVGMSRMASASVLEGTGDTPAATAAANEAAAETGGEVSPAPAAEATAPAASETPAESATPAAESAAAPASAEASAPAAAGAGDATAGKEVFTGSCAGCHGANGEGGVGPALNAAAGWDLAGFSAALREGKTPDGRELAAMMPRFTPAQLDDTQLANIHAFVQTLK